MRLEDGDITEQQPGGVLKIEFTEDDVMILRDRELEALSGLSTVSTTSQDDDVAQADWVTPQTRQLIREAYGSPREKCANYANINVPAGSVSLSTQRRSMITVCVPAGTSPTGWRVSRNTEWTLEILAPPRPYLRGG